jgi:transposase InsO family protein
MKDEGDRLDKKIGLFRYSLIADLLHLPRGKGSGLYEKLREKAEKEYDIPGTDRREVAAETIRDWLTVYRREGFDGLLPRRRSDKGRARKLPIEVIDLLVLAKEANPEMTVPLLIEEAKEHEIVVNAGVKLAESTVYRHLKAAGVMDLGKKSRPGKELRRFSFEKAGELWMSDVMHGPKVFDESRRKTKSYLIGFLDDATRIVPFACFASSEKTRDFLPAFQQAIERRGIPKRLYVDNGSAYRSRHLQMVCARLGITLIHARPYHAAGKGKQERFFRTVRMQLLPKLTDNDLKSFEALNRRLWGWVEGSYHQRPHRGLNGQSPVEAWAQRSDQVRLVGVGSDLRELFLFEARRKVQKDRTVSLDGMAYEVDASLVGEVVLLRFDQSNPGSTIDVWHGGKKIGTANLVDAYLNCFVKRNRGSWSLEPSVGPDEPAPGLSLRSLNDEKEES